MCISQDLLKIRSAIKCLARYSGVAIPIISEDFQLDHIWDRNIGVTCVFYNMSTLAVDLTTFICWIIDNHQKEYEESYEESYYKHLPHIKPVTFSENHQLHLHLLQLAGVVMIQNDDRVVYEEKDILYSGLRYTFLKTRIECPLLIRLNFDPLRRVKPKYYDIYLPGIVFHGVICSVIQTTDLNKELKPEAILVLDRTGLIRPAIVCKGHKLNLSDMCYVSIYSHIRSVNKLDAKKTHDYVYKLDIPRVLKPIVVKTGIRYWNYYRFNYEWWCDCFD